jgi:transcriptional regulator with XRE-family HTH domain
MTALTQPAAQYTGSGALADESRAAGNGLVGPVIRRHRLGAELRRLREAASLRLEDAAAELGVAPSTLSRIETGQAPARTSYVRILLALYGVTDPAVLSDLTDLAREGQRKGWWTEHQDLLPPGAGTHLGLEAAAAASRTFATQVLPGLVQTSEYAAARWKAARPYLNTGEIRSLVTVTLRRQELLPDGHQLHLVIDEAVLFRQIGSPPIMAAQLSHLRELAASPAVTLQILALSTPRPVLSAPFTLLGFRDPADPDLASRQGAGGQIVVTRSTATVDTLRGTFAALARAAISAGASAGLITELARQR